MATLRGVVLSCVTATLLAQLAHADVIPAYIANAITDAIVDLGRPDVDIQRDVKRKPVKVMAFAGIKPGDKVADFMPGNGYYTRILCKAVGESGHVYAISIPLDLPAQHEPNGQSAMQKVSSDKPEILVPRCNNVTASNLLATRRAAPELHSSNEDPGWVYEYWSFSAAAENFAVTEPLDVIWVENYHDLHNQAYGLPNMQLVNKALLQALKPGGRLIIEDHLAATGSGARDTETLHRIDAAQVRKEVLAAGFVFVSESRLLRNAKDTHITAARDMDDSTDRFLLKFRRPER
jgi:predicted methyltransferase